MEEKLEKVETNMGQAEKRQPCSVEDSPVQEGAQRSWVKAAQLISYITRLSRGCQPPH